MKTERTLTSSHPDESPKPTAARRLPLVVCALLTLASPATAQVEPAIDEDSLDLTDLSLEELMGIDLEVTSVSKKPQRLRDTPAAIYVITQEDLRRSGVVSIPEALRMVPGLHVARLNSSVYAISARGFNGQFANKLLVLVDGRSVYTPLFSGVFWELQDLILEDIDRIEVIRGPGAAIWGANAVNGVINIITKTAAETQGGLISAVVGSEERHNLSLRYGGEMQDGHWRVWGKTFHRDSLETLADADGNDDHDMDRAGFRMDLEPRAGDTLTVSGSAYNGRINFPQVLPDLASPPTSMRNFNDRASGGHLMTRWQRELAGGGEVSLQLFYDRYNRRNSLYEETRDTLDLEFQHRTQPAEGHDVVWGIGGRASKSRVATTELTAASSETNTEQLLSVFIQDEIELREDLALTLGTKLERNTYTGWEIQPDARLTWTPNEHETWWAALSRAVRTPSGLNWEGLVSLSVLPDSPFPGFNTLVQLQGNEHVVSEELTSFQVGYRVDVNEQLSLDIATFYQRYDDLVTFEMGTGTPIGPTTILLPIISDNKQDGRTLGLEVVADWRPSDDWDVEAAYSYIDMELHTDSDSTNLYGDEAEHDVPQDQFNLRIHHDINEQWEVDFGLFYVDTLPRRRVQSYWSGNLRVGYRPNQDSEVSFGLVNLFHDEEAEWADEFFTSSNAMEASAYLRYTRRF